MSRTPAQCRGGAGAGLRGAGVAAAPALAAPALADEARGLPARRRSPPALPSLAAPSGAQPLAACRGSGLAAWTRACRGMPALAAPTGAQPLAVGRGLACEWGPELSRPPGAWRPGPGGYRGSRVGEARRPGPADGAGDAAAGLGRVPHGPPGDDVALEEWYEVLADLTDRQQGDLAAVHDHLLAVAQRALGALRRGNPGRFSLRLFGSRASRLANPGSDVDVVCELPTGYPQAARFDLVAAVQALLRSDPRASQVVDCVQQRAMVAYRYARLSVDFTASVGPAAGPRDTCRITAWLEGQPPVLRGLATVVADWAKRHGLAWDGSTPVAHRLKSFHWVLAVLSWWEELDRMRTSGWQRPCGPSSASSPTTHS